MTNMQLRDLEVLRDIPGYKVILKTVLKSQIQMLVQQLSEETGEESLILTASIMDGTLCHMGSYHGRDFLDGRDEIKTQFLKHCLTKLQGMTGDSITESLPTRPTDAHPHSKSLRQSPYTPTNHARTGWDRTIPATDCDTLQGTATMSLGRQSSNSGDAGTSGEGKSRKRRKMSDATQEGPSESDLAGQSSVIIKTEQSSDSDYENMINNEMLDEGNTGVHMTESAERDQMAGEEWGPVVSEFGDAGNHPDAHVTSSGTSKKNKKGRRFQPGSALSEAIRTSIVLDIIDAGGNIETGKVPYGMYTRIGKTVGVDSSTVCRIWERYVLDGTIAPRVTDTGRPPKHGS